MAAKKKSRKVSGQATVEKTEEPVVEVVEEQIEAGGILPEPDQKSPEVANVTEKVENESEKTEESGATSNEEETPERKNEEGAMADGQNTAQIDVSSGLGGSPDGKKLWFFVGAVVFGIILTILTLYVRDWLMAKNAISQKTDNTPPVTQNVPPKPQLNLADYSVSVLNGSGKTGVAAKTREMLEAAGFKVERAGNAKTSGFDYTLIEAKRNVPSEFITKLSETLAKSYQLASASGTLDASASADVVVTVGSLLAR